MPKFSKLKMLIFSFGIGLFCAVTLFPAKQPRPKIQAEDVSAKAEVYKYETGQRRPCEDGLYLADSDSGFEK